MQLYCVQISCKRLLQLGGLHSSLYLIWMGSEADVETSRHPSKGQSLGASHAEGRVAWNVSSGIFPVDAVHSGVAGPMEEGCACMA